MYYHTGLRYQRGAGFASLFSGLFKMLKPLASMGLKAGKQFIGSNFAKKAGSAMLESGLFAQALEIGHAATDFNPNAPSGWALILANSSAPMVERKNAALEISRLDPFNKIIKNYKY